MVTDPNSQDSAIVAAFLSRFLADQSRGEVKPLSAYREAFPGHDALIEQHYEELTSPDGRTINEPEPTDSWRRVGHYRLLREIGRGGQGEVHLAEDLNLNRRVALKVLRKFDIGSPDLMARFRREAAVASRLDHPGIATVYESDVADNVPYIAMRYIEGESLAARIDAAKKQTPPPSTVREKSDRSDSLADGRSRAGVLATVRFIEDAARAVQAAHEAGIIHRDLKPGNIMVTPEGRPVILDFGLARDLESDQLTFTRSGDLFGTPHYMSPEQLAANRVPIDLRTDVYSLAVTLYEALTHHRPFEATTREAVYQAVLTKEPPDPRRYNSAIPFDLRVVLETALEKDRDRRYDTAAAFADDLARVRKSLPIQARPIGRLHRISRWIRREPAKAALATAVLFLAGGAGYAVHAWPEVSANRELAARLDRQERIERRLQYAFERLHNQETTQAAAEFEEVLKLDATTLEAIAGLAMSLQQQHRYKEALAVLDRDRSLSTAHPGLASVRAKILERLGQPVQGAPTTAALRRHRDPVTWFILAMQEMHLGHFGDDDAFSRAADLMMQCVLAAPQSRPLYRFELAHAVGHVERPQLASEIANALETRYPTVQENPTARFWLAFLLHDADPQRGLEAVDTLIAHDPEFAAAHQIRGVCLHSLGKPEEAEKALREAVRIEPKLTMALTNLAVILNERGRYEEATKTMRAALEITPGNLVVLRNYGSLLRLGKDYENAVRVLSKVVKQLPNAADAWGELGRAHRQLKNYEVAAAAFRKCGELDPDRITEIIKFAECVRDGGEPAKALEILEDVCRRRGDEADAHGARAFTLNRLNRRAEAALAWDRAVELKPDSPRFYYDRGITLYMLGRYEEAAASFEESVALDDQSGETHCNLGHAYLQLARYREAKEAYERAHRIGLAQPNWKYPTRRYIENATRQDREQAVLIRIDEGASMPADPRRLLALAQIAYRERRYSLAGRLFMSAFDVAPRIAEDPRRGRRYNAASASILAFAGKGEDAKLSLEERIVWRRRGYDLLDADLARWQDLLDAEEVTEKEATTWLKRWKINKDYAAVRDPEKLEAVQKQARDEWRGLWRRVDDMLEALASR